MHMIYDEHGNPVAHGAHSHEHQHEHGNKTEALLAYMLEHNQHHAEELQEVADTLEQEGYQEAAAQIREGVAEFQKGNIHLGKALEYVK